MHRTSQHPTVVELTKGNDDGMLRTEAGRTDQPDGVDTGAAARYPDPSAGRTGHGEP